MGLKERLIEMRWRAAGHLSSPLPPCFVSELAGGRALEIGGPSAVFGSGGMLPVYPALDSVDGVQWTAHTVWHELDAGAGYRLDGERRGELHVIDGLDLNELPESSYDAVISSHVIEHLANPLRALAAWRRVTREGGHLLIVAPHMQGTFDRHRPLTSLEHMVEDFRRGTEEDDLTHLDETLQLHDRRRDAEREGDEAWVERRRSNASTRVLHHHTFTTPSLLALLDRAGVQLLVAVTRFPHDIYVLGRWPGPEEAISNEAFLAIRRRSPFSADRRRTA